MPVPRASARGRGGQDRLAHGASRGRRPRAPASAPQGPALLCSKSSRGVTRCARRAAAHVVNREPGRRRPLFVRCAHGCHYRSEGAVSGACLACGLALCQRQVCASPLARHALSAEKGDRPPRGRRATRWSPQASEQYSVHLDAGATIKQLKLAVLPPPTTGRTARASQLPSCAPVLRGRGPWHRGAALARA